MAHFLFKPAPLLKGWYSSLRTLIRRFARHLIHRVHSKFDTVGEFKLSPKQAPGGMGKRLVLQKPKLWFGLEGDAATSRRDGGD